MNAQQGPLSHGGQHPRDKLAACCGASGATSRRGSLRHALHRALADTHPPPLRIEGQTLALDADRVEVDVGTLGEVIRAIATVAAGDAHVAMGRKKARRRTQQTARVTSEFPDVIIQQAGRGARNLYARTESR